ncbi:DUF488 domain-containing protein [uncultured Rubinisphaera sp.]|uniref:DUF488 domain-containing protein n=1 Tax=uncultured Rubinisphaera sp. TaxID=1678686 RepID=UPI0030DDA807
MLNRQKTLLTLLVTASRGVSKLELTKWAFLVRQETTSQGGNAFYDFLPYKYGPFSFCLYREIDGLVRDGYVDVMGDSSLNPTDLAVDVVESLSRNVRKDSLRIVQRFKALKSDYLIDYVYNQYPSYTVNSERQKLVKRKVAEPKVFTAGYEQMSVDAFLNRLIDNGIQRIIDVRNNPIARRYGFHKSTLSRLAGYLNIEYVHIPELGIDSSRRRNLITDGDYQKLFNHYEQETILVQKEAVDRVASLVKEKASVLVCMEANPICCHRSRLANAVAELTDLNIHDLGYCMK